MKKYSSFLLVRSFILKISLAVVLFTVFTSTSVQAQYNRKIIFEEFSEVWCGPCAQLAPMITKWLDNHPEYIPVTFYSSFIVNNTQNCYDKDGYNERKSFYSVPFYPYARINAVNAPNDDYPGYPTDTVRINSIIDTMSKDTPVKIQIDFINEGSTGTVKVDVTSDVALQNKTLHIFLVEKHHTYSVQSNGQTEFHHIMRKSLPDADGENLNIQAGETKHFEFNYSIDYEINFDMFATALVQDNSTKYIYQAESVFKSPTSVEENVDTENILSVYPNPVSDNIGISINQNQEIISKVEIFDILGNRIKSINIGNAERNFSLSGADLQDGVYFLKVLAGNSTYVRKFVVKK